MQTIGEITLTLIADNGEGVEVRLEKSWPCVGGDMDRNVEDMLTRGSSDLLSRYRAIQEGTA